MGEIRSDSLLLPLRLVMCGVVVIGCCNPGPYDSELSDEESDDDRSGSASESEDSENELITMRRERQREEFNRKQRARLRQVEQEEKDAMGEYIRVILIIRNTCQSQWVRKVGCWWPGCYKSIYNSLEACPPSALIRCL